MRHTVFEMNCEHCNNIGPAKVVVNGPHTGLHCGTCSKWLKWASKEEKFAFTDDSGVLEVEENATMLPPVVGESNRSKEWLDFMRLVLEHIENYTVPQYGDYPDDQLTEMPVNEIQMNMKRYLNRMHSNARGIEETLRDMMKMAHYSCVAYYKLLQSFAASENRTQQEGEDEG